MSDFDRLAAWLTEHDLSGTATVPHVHVDGTAHPLHGRRLERRRVRVVGSSRSYRRGQVIELDAERAESAIAHGWAELA